MLPKIEPSVVTADQWKLATGCTLPNGELWLMAVGDVTCPIAPTLSIVPPVSRRGA